MTYFKTLLNTLLVLLLVFSFPSALFARIGVGVTTGKIFVTDELRQGSINNINPVTVVNTGDETTIYTVSVGYHMQQEELRPPAEWFTFSPQEFELAPGETQRVDVVLNLPLKGVQPDDYLAYLEAEPLKRADRGGGTSVGIAAATKLYFSVAPSNIFEGIFYRTVSLFREYSPWSYAGGGLLLFVILLTLFRRSFAFDISVKKK